MKANTLRELTLDELKQKYTDFKEELFNLKFQKVMGQLENNMRIGQVRKDIARVLTLITEKERTAKTEEAKA
ncbi:MAG: 50S ribosomal protein L29 [Candidatus Wallbacteria bacterium]|nr:50S ribosomal protein L29 [Candidatus Wallbacteria bacterium]